MKNNKTLFFRKSMLGFIICMCLYTMESCSQPPVNVGDNLQQNPTGKKKKIKLALLLDTSNSMDGLIEQAKSQLWKIVNELSLATCEGQKPDIEIALFEYGNDGLSEEKGFIRMVCPLSNDLDNISKSLFSLTTNGGSEYCGHVIQSAVKLLQWSNNDDDLQMIFIAGNEAFTQGNVNYTKACAEAKAKNIVVNTIFCGNFNEGINTFWKNGADIADGSYMSIDQNSKTVYIETPYDKQISALNDSLNKTYIGYGSYGKEKKAMQAKEDNNAYSYGAANSVERTVSKSRHVYKNDSWDLVDAEKEGKVAVEKMKAEDLPAEMQTMDSDQRKAYVKENSAKRETINKKIAELNANRSKYIAAEQSKMNATDQTLDNSMIQAIKQQAGKKKLVFE